MTQRIEVDLAKAFEQMEQQPDLIGKIEQLVTEQAPAFSQIIDQTSQLAVENAIDKAMFCKGWVRIHLKRELDADKNPISDWEVSTYGRPWSGSGLANPYLYTAKGRAGKDGHTYDSPIYSDEGNPGYPSWNDYNGWNDPEYIKARDIYNEWFAQRPITGYWQYKIEIKEAGMVLL